MPFKYAHTRKACYQYSWDWAPQLVTMGIWRDVELKLWSGIRFDYVWVRNKIITKSKAVLNFAVQFNDQLDNIDKKYDDYYIVVKQKSNLISQVTQIIKGDKLYVDVTVPNPKFWWPNGVGEPFMYDF